MMNMRLIGSLSLPRDVSVGHEAGVRPCGFATRTWHTSRHTAAQWTRKWGLLHFVEVIFKLNVGCWQKTQQISNKESILRNQVHDAHLQKKKKCQHLAYLTFLIRKGSIHLLREWIGKTSGVRFEHIYSVPCSPPLFCPNNPQPCISSQAYRAEAGFCWPTT